MRFTLTLACLVLAPLAVGAQESKKEVGPVKVIKIERKTPIAYEEDIEPIFYKRCTVCHSGNLKEGRLDVSSYESLMKGGKSGDTVKPAKADESILYKAMGRTTPPGARPRAMPPKGDEPCTPEELALVKLWIDQGAKAPKTIRKNKEIIVSTPPANVHQVRAVAVSPDKSAVAAGRGNRIDIYDPGSGKHIRTLLSPGLKTPDGKEVKAAHLSIVESMAWSPDGKWLVTGSFKEITIWDALTGEQRQKIDGFAHMVVALAFSPDGKLLGVGGGEPTVDGEVKIYEVGTWKLFCELKNCHSDTVYGLAFSPDMKLPIPGEKKIETKKEEPKKDLTKDKKDAAKDKKEPEKKDDTKYRDVKLIATCSADKFVKVWEIPSGKMLKSFEGHTHHVLDVGWMADGKLLASAGADNTVKIWDFDKGEQARTINAHAKQVTRLIFVGKKAEFITAGGDNAVKKFNAASGGNTGNYTGGTDFIYAIAVSPDGAIIVAGGQEGVVRVYNGANSQLSRSLLPPEAQPPMKEEKKK